MVEPPSETVEIELSLCNDGLERFVEVWFSLLDFLFDRPSQLRRIL